MNRLQRSTINLIAGGAGFAAPLVISFVTVPLLLSSLGPAAYGLQNLVNAVIGYFMLTEMGMDLAIIRFLAEDHARGDTRSEIVLVSTTMQLCGLLGCVGFTVIWLAAEFLAQRVFVMPPLLVGSAIAVFRWAALGFFGNMLALWGRAVMVGLQRLDVSNAVSLLTSVIGTGLGLAAIYAGYGVVGYVAGRVVVAMLGGLCYLPLARRCLPTFRLRWGVDRMTLRRISSYVRYGLATRTLGMVTAWLDNTLIAVWLGVAMLAFYVPPFTVATSLVYLIGNMLQFIFPMASELYSTGRKAEFQRIFTQATRFSASFANLVFVPLFVLGDRFLTLWLGVNVATQSAIVFRLILTAGYVSVSSITLVNQVMPATGHMREYTLYQLVRVVVFALGCGFLIRPLGINGAGWALLAASLADLAFGSISMRHYLGFSLSGVLREAYLRPMALGILIGGLAYLARPLTNSWFSLAAVSTVLGATYVIAGYSIRIFGETEKRAVLGLWHLLAERLWPTEGQP